MKKISEMTVDVGVDIIIKEQTARLAVDVLNLYFRSNPDKIPILDFHEDPDGSKYCSISIENNTAKRPEVDADQYQKNEDPDTLPHWETQYFDNKPMLFYCSKCGCFDTVKRAACYGCGREMKID